MKKFYFFKNVVFEGRVRLKPLPDQTFEDGTPIDTTWNTSCSRSIRSMYPVGTIFGSETCTIVSTYYSVGDIYPIGLADGEYKMDTHKPSEELLEAYALFIGAATSSAMAEKIASDTDKVESVVRGKVSLLSKMRKNEKYNVPLVKEDGFFVSEDNWYLLLRNIQNCINTMMIGPTGTGKTELILLACEKLGIDCHVYDMGSMYDPIAGLLGVHRLQEGGSVFDYAKFTEDIQKPGVILLDELSRAPVTTNNILFPCLDSRRMLPVEIAGGRDTRSISVHEDCCFVATANVGSEYTGTMSMDRALVNRFFPIELDYMPSDREVNVLVKRCRVSHEEASHIVTVANSIRNLFRKSDLSVSVSTRETMASAELVADGWSVMRALELTVLPLFEGTMSDGERGTVAKLLTGK